MGKVHLREAAVVLLAFLQMGLCGPSSDLMSDYGNESQEGQLPGASDELAMKRNSLLSIPPEALLLDSRERRSNTPAGSSFIRFGRSGSSNGGAISPPHTRSDVIIRYGRDGAAGPNSRLTRLRQERMRKMARLALLCAESRSQQDDYAMSSTEDKILREICRDTPLHPTVPDFV
ncbi:hypothetical protein TKK_0012846 [Trichogramma kaykai]|uniref:Uncharacterized protein n=1 Tax=Trichogramma kaykai TaxID=54128 RepID=A0ABD2WKY4_9HYME